MQTIPLGPTGKTTTRLGFGCSAIMGSLNRRQSLAILESAFDSGIRHFDTAPMYGLGEAESCLGDFLVRHRGEVTVTTKFGIPPPGKKALWRVARQVAGPVIQQFPGLRKSLPKALNLRRGATQPASVTRAANPIFTAEQAHASLESSLTALKTDHIDLWFLHEVSAEDLADTPESDRLLRCMEDAVSAGKIGSFGVGSDGSLIDELLSRYPGFCPVTQYDWSILKPAIPATAHFRIHHSSLSSHFQSLAAQLRAMPAQCEQWSREVDRDLSSAANLAKLMLKASLLLNSESVVLFSSKNVAHIRANVAAAEDRSLEEAALRLHQLFQREGASILSFSL